MSCHSVAQPRDASQGGSYRTIAVVGPPNSGKTTLFNRLTKLRQKVGNFPGVTVEHHTGYIRDINGEEVALIDLPGVYSLTPKSEDEKVAIDVLTGKMPGTPAPDAVILVLNSTNLHTHLVLAARVIALGVPTLVLLNMADELRKQQGHLDVLSLARELGTPVALVSATTGEGLNAVQNFLASAAPTPEPLELPVVGSTRGYREWAVRVGKNAGYKRPATPVWTARLDAIFLHRIWGPVIFALVVIGVFQTIFALGQPLSNLLQKFLDTTGVAIGNHLPQGMFQSLLVNGVWKGTGSVLVFLPQILLLFLVIGVLEDSGLLVARGGYRRPYDVPRRLERQEFHPFALRLCLRGAGHHGDAHHREQARPHGDHPDRSVHDLFGATAGVHHGDRGIPAEPAVTRAVPGNARGGDAWAVRFGICDGCAYGAPAEVNHPEEQGRSVYPRDAALPLADCGFIRASPG